MWSRGLLVDAGEDLTSFDYEFGQSRPQVGCSGPPEVLSESQACTHASFSSLARTTHVRAGDL
jgi:hypothetical protein